MLFWRMIELDRSRSHDPDGDPIKFRWKVVSSNLDVLIQNLESVRPMVTINDLGVYYAFEWTVIDEKCAVVSTPWR